MTDAMIGESKTKPARTRAARRFKNLRAQIDHFTTTEERVANMKVIHADLTVLKTALSARVDRRLRLISEIWASSSRRCTRKYA